MNRSSITHYGQLKEISSGIHKAVEDTLHCRLSKISANNKIKKLTRLTTLTSSPHRRSV